MAKRKAAETETEERLSLILEEIEDLPPAPRRGRGPGIDPSALQAELYDIAPKWAKIQEFEDDPDGDEDKPLRQARSRVTTLRPHFTPFSIEVTSRKNAVYARYNEEVTEAS